MKDINQLAIFSNNHDVLDQLKHKTSNDFLRLKPLKEHFGVDSLASTLARLSGKMIVFITKEQLLALSPESRAMHAVMVSEVLRAVKREEVDDPIATVLILDGEDVLIELFEDPIEGVDSFSVCELLELGFPTNWEAAEVDVLAADGKTVLQNVHSVLASKLDLSRWVISWNATPVKKTETTYATKFNTETVRIGDLTAGSKVRFYRRKTRPALKLVK